MHKAIASAGLLMTLVAGCHSTNGEPVAATSSATSSTKATTSRSSKTTTTTTTSTKAAQHDSGVPVGSLEQILLSADEVGGVLSIGMQQIDQWTGLTRDDATPAGCGPVLELSSQTLYRGSGYVGLRSRSFQDDPQNFQRLASEVAASLPSEEAAAGLVHKAAGIWQQCSGGTVTYPVKDQSFRWQPLPPDETDGLVTMTVRSKTTPGWNCGRAITSARNVVIETAVCGVAGIDRKNGALIGKLRDRVPPS